MGNTECCERDYSEDYHKTYPINNVQEYKISSSTRIVERKRDVLSSPINELIEKKSSKEYSLKGESKEEGSKGISIEVVYLEPKIPELSQAIRQRLESYKQFEERFNFTPVVKQFGSQIYAGQLDKQTMKPEGYGKMYKQDGSLFIGQFTKGKAKGHGVYLFTDGSYYSGHFSNNCADGEGLLWTSSLEYEGGFKKNQFHGKGIEKSAVHQYVGEFYEGNRTQGTYKWKVGQQEYVFSGHFNFSNQFHGSGTLIEPKGTYIGNFVNGIKQGEGVYKYKSGIRYEGSYKNGLKEGKGTLFNYGDTIAYEGDFSNDVPHGIGRIPHPSTKQMIESRWVEGIDATLL